MGEKDYAISGRPLTVRDTPAPAMGASLTGIANRTNPDV
jgi:hypothetical protein